MCITSIFVDKGMDWKLGGFEFLIGTAELDEGYVNNLKELLPKKYQSPELARGNTQALKQIPVAADWCARGRAPPAPTRPVVSAAIPQVHARRAKTARGTRADGARESVAERVRAC